MTEKDKKLIAEARQTSYIDWGHVMWLRDQTDTLEAYDIIDRIARDLALTEKYHTGTP